MLMLVGGVLFTLWAPLEIILAVESALRHAISAKPA